MEKYQLRANIQYDIYSNTKQVLKSIRAEHTNRLQTQLKSQGFIISFLLEHSLQNTADTKPGVYLPNKQVINDQWQMTSLNQPS